MCTIEGDIGTIAATGTTPDTATIDSACSYLYPATSQALYRASSITEATGTTEGPLATAFLVHKD